MKNSTAEKESIFLIGLGIILALILTLTGKVTWWLREFYAGLTMMALGSILPEVAVSSTVTPIGEGYDLVLACSCLEAAKDIDPIVKKVYNALNTGGAFASIFNSGLTQERTKPEPLVLSMLSMALMGHDSLFDQGSVADSMLRVGFKSVRSPTLNTPWGPTELNIARK